MTRIKVCGITRLEDAQKAVELGAWALGFIFQEKSPRAIAAENAGKIVRRFPGMKTVGVFVDADLSSIDAAVKTSGVNTVQLHGGETPEFCRALQKQVPGLKIIKALRLRERLELGAIPAYGECCEALLVDAYVPGGAHGGTGVQGDWDLAREARSFSLPLLLAGGLNPSNIQSALDKVQPFGVDVSSGLESAPGVKSHELMEQFFSNAKGARL